MAESRARKSRRKWWALVAATLVAAYGLVGFLVVPGLVRSALEERLARLLDREVTVGKIGTNPFALSVSVDDFLVGDRDGQPLVSWDHLYLNVQMSSILPGRIVLRELTLVDPRLRVRVEADGSVGLAEIIERIATTGEGESEESAEPPVIRVGLIDISGAAIDFADFMRATPFRSQIGPVAIHLEDFSTHRDSRNPYSFEGSTASGAEFAWSGYFHLDPIRSGGELTVDRFPLRVLAPYYEDRVGFDVREGVLGVKASYDLLWSAEERSVGLTALEATVTALRLTARADDEVVVDMPSVELAGGEVDVLGGTVEVASIATIGGSVVVRRSPAGSINLVELLTMPGDRVPDDRPEGAEASAPFLVHVGSISASEYTVAFEDLVPARPVSLTVLDAGFEVRDAGNRPDDRPSALVHLRSEAGGSARVEGTLDPNTLKGDLLVGVEGLDVTPLAPYVDSIAGVRVSSGLLTANGRVHFELQDRARPAMEFRGDARLDGFGSTDAVLEEPFLDWESLVLSSVAVATAPPSLEIARVSLQEPVARLVLTRDGGRNLDGVFGAGDDDATETGPSPRISIGAVRVENGRLDGEDRWFDPPLFVVISDIDTAVQGLSSEPGAPAELEFRALLAEVTALHVSGTIDPLGDSLAADLTVEHSAFDLRPVGPYLERFLGFRLDEGRVDMDLACTIDGDVLDGAATVVFDPLELGEPVESPDAVDAPIKLGLSLLRDRKGRIELELPIAGDLSDPQFRISAVLGKAMGGAVRNVATAPFKFLGRAFGGGDEDLSHVEFAPGSAELRESEMEKIDVIADGLYDRPSLVLRVDGSADEEDDAGQLRREDLDRRLRETMREAIALTDSDPPPVEDITVTADQRTVLIARLYVEAFPDEATGEPETARTADGRPIPGIVVHPGLPSELEMERRLLDAVPIRPEDLDRLAATRADRVVDYLLDSGQVEPDRVILEKLGGRAARQEGSRVYFDLE